jgi:hypothetical protein
MNHSRQGRTHRRRRAMTSLYFSFQALLTSLRKTGELLPAKYGADIGPSEYLKVLGERFRETGGWEADPKEVSNRRFKYLLISKRLYATESCQ